ncbi:hypothetical protein GCK72_015274 [Caenorhabditis remanei]|uniref:Uncharacterized protein n=1 Tax=Caenorhabditis remanei TaxID=31234 RepID=A0A6A5GVY4_CAERE|nr:hypothetical protein GCK72_015274 [Caenorhabditis remanei]KAF1758814.1 hypothetical protein GCK72_015274 [Caenorhabditis remanei]
MPSSSSSRCSSSASLASTTLSVSSSTSSSISSSIWKAVELKTLPLPSSSSSSSMFFHSAFSIPTKLCGVEIELEMEPAVIQNLTEELEKAELENSILKQKMDILGIEIGDISKKLEKCQVELEGKRLKFEQLSAGNRMANIVLKNQQKEIGSFRMAEKIWKHQQEQLQKLRVTQQEKQNQKPWNYGESWRSNQTVEKNEKPCDKKEGSEDVKLLVNHGYKKAEAEHIMKQVMEIRKMEATK